MNYGPVMLTTNLWMGLEQAASHVCVTRDELIEAITARQVRATITHPARPGDWMVPLGDVKLWARQRSLVEAVF